MTVGFIYTAPGTGLLVQDLATAFLTGPTMGGRVIHASLLLDPDPELPPGTKPHDILTVSIPSPKFVEIMLIDQPRCPYCVEDDEFKLLAPIGNERFCCDRCGHLWSPSEPKFVCECSHCVQLRAVPARSRKAS